MTYSFDIEKLDEMLKSFYTITKITMSVWDADFNQLTFYPKPMASICTKIKSCSAGKSRCLDSDIEACAKAAVQKDAYKFTCHVGLVDVSVPIYYGDEIIAYIMFGQMRDEEQSLSCIENVKALCKKYGIDEKSTEEYYNDLPVLSHKQIDAIANLFKMCIPYFYESRAIKMEQNETASKINEYILNNLATPLTVKQLCDNFRISINELYQLSHKYFNTSIKDYIIFKRIEGAKHYLSTTNLQIAEICTMVGFHDYNYFIRTFKSRTGYTPLVYRKKFPLNIL